MGKESGKEYIYVCVYTHTHIQDLELIVAQIINSL